MKDLCVALKRAWALLLPLGEASHSSLRGQLPPTYPPDPLIFPGGETPFSIFTFYLRLPEQKKYQQDPLLPERATPVTLFIFPKYHFFYPS